MLIRLGLNPSPLGLGLEGNKGVLSKKKVFPNLAIFAGLRKNGLTGESNPVLSALSEWINHTTN